MENEMIWNAVSPICGLFVFSASLHRGGGANRCKIIRRGFIWDGTFLADNNRLLRIQIDSRGQLPVFLKISLCRKRPLSFFPDQTFPQGEGEPVGDFNNVTHK